LFLSNDWYFGIAIAPTGSMAKKKELNPDGLLFTTRKTVPYLRKLGVSEQAIRQLTIENPKRFFGGEAAS
jgi:predicted metal-dependent phosphotriesterase family hydrolase